MSDNGNGNGKVLAGDWLGFPPYVDHDQALARFLEKYGYPAARVVESLGLVLVGPIGQRPQAEAGLLRRLGTHRQPTPEAARAMIEQAEQMTFLEVAT